MAKSIRSKIKKRLRTVKRQRVDAMLVAPREKDHHEQLQRVSEGRAVTLSKPKNAFKYPQATGAVFPQHEVGKPIDFRAQNLPMAGYAFRGNRRKYEGEQADFMQALAKTSHPKMEVLAGGGAVLAADGRKVSMKEAALLATAAERPREAALAAAPPTAASAVEAALQESATAPQVTLAAAASGATPASATADASGDAEMAPEATLPAEPEPQGAADHTRRPVLKDERRAKRAAAHRPRSNAAKKETGKVHVEAPAAAPPAKKATAAAAPSAAAANKTKKKKGK